MANRICKVDGCDRPARGRGWCTMHYQRWQRTRDPTAVIVAQDRAVIASGSRFGRLMVLELLDERRDHKRVYRCRCDCGREASVLGVALRSGHTKSCGCWKRQVGGLTATTHGLKDHPLYKTWMGMRSRCNNPNHSRYRDYGGRGITVDPRWNDFAAFVVDMGEKPGPEYSLDRIDNDGPYSPENCRWATPVEQAQNVRRR